MLAARSWQGRPRRGDPPKPLPGWMRALDGMTGAKALRTGVLLGGLNPKNILLLMAGEAAVAQTEHLDAHSRSLRWRSSSWSARSASCCR